MKTRTLVASLFFFIIFFLVSSESVHASTVIPASTIIGNTFWTKAASPYIVSYANIPIGSSLTIEPGTVVKFTYPARIDIYGSLAIGSASSSEKVILTSIKDDSVSGDTNGDGSASLSQRGDWSGIRIFGGHTTVANAIFRYGSASVAQFYVQGGNAEVTQSQFTLGLGANVTLISGTLSILDSDISQSATAGVLNFSGNLTVHRSSIHDNGGYGGAYNVSAVPVDLRDNWWGDASGPFHSTQNPGGSGNMVSDNINFTPWLTSDPFVTEEPPLSTRAASLAKAVVGGAYLGDGSSFGGKGWDPLQKKYVTVNEIFGGYNYWNNKLRTIRSGVGLDCSGLVQWAFNRAFDPSKNLLSNAIRYDSADGQYKNNSTITTELDIQPGDMLFLDKNSDSRIDHVAMYVGEFENEGKIFDMIEAFSPQAGIRPAKFSEFKNRPGYIALGNTGLRRIALSPAIAGAVKAGSPIDLIVTDPDDLTITAETASQTDEEYLREIPGELYYTENILGSDGRPEDVIYWPKRKLGNYAIKVVPESGVASFETYDLEFVNDDQTIILAHDVPIGEIPTKGYGVSIGEGGATMFIPIAIDIKPESSINSINLGSGGNIPVAIFGNTTFDVRQIDPESIRLANAGVRLKGNGKSQLDYVDINGDGFLDVLVHITTEALQLTTNDVRAELSGTLLDGRIFKGSDSVRIVP